MFTDDLTQSKHFLIAKCERALLGRQVHFQKHQDGGGQSAHLKARVISWLLHQSFICSLGL